jgi:hypothetical protein
LTPEGYVEFEIYRVSPPTGEDAMDAPVKVGPIVRTPPLQRTGRTSFPPEESLEPQESKTYDLNVGYHYNITTPGRYTMRVHFENQTSNEVSFEVAPIKRVGVAPDELVSNLSRYEGGEPQYPYMFYVAPTRARHDLLFVMHRVGEGAERHFERKDIAHVQVDSLPQVMARGKRVGILVKDPYQLGQWHAFTIDLSSLPLQIERKTYELDPESRPSLAGGVDGLFTIESEPVPPSAIHIQRAFPRTPSEE